MTQKPSWDKILEPPYFTLIPTRNSHNVSKEIQTLGILHPPRHTHTTHQDESFRGSKLFRRYFLLPPNLLSFMLVSIRTRLRELFNPLKVFNICSTLETSLTICFNCNIFFSVSERTYQVQSNNIHLLNELARAITGHKISCKLKFRGNFTFVSSLYSRVSLCPLIFKTYGPLPDLWNCSIIPLLSNFYWKMYPFLFLKNRWKGHFEDQGNISYISKLGGKVKHEHIN